MAEIIPWNEFEETYAKHGRPAKSLRIVLGSLIRMEKLSWDAYNECESLIPIVGIYKAKNGIYPEKVLPNKIYINKKLNKWN